MSPESFWRRRSVGFRVAFRGIAILVRTQFHARIHLLATIVVIVAGISCSVSRTEWCLLVLSIGLVWASEAVNTAIEAAVDLASPEFHELAGSAKDVAAGAVLLASLAAAVVGGLIFGPRLL